ncbi:hypothetical protein OIV83_003415 [Microbotryomycetes sp. JL201]|nr:hypothetical protein OIV83_003415 [Microbotryomycetes sp. JL201]
MTHQSANHNHNTNSHKTSTVPTIKLGRTRCYWCILTPSLDFAFLDPVLHTHLGAESKLFIGTNLLDYIHPDERDALGNDLLPKVGANGGIEASGVFGSITRCRYSRLPRIRRLLGCSSPETDPDAAKYVSDDLFLPLAITTSWIGGGNVQHDASSGMQLKGAVLAFFHATEGKRSLFSNKDEEKDNDEASPSSWTNWCGPRVEDGPYLDERRCRQMVQALSWATGIDPQKPPDGPYPPQHVFQILDHEGHILVSFPNTGHRYGAEEYAALARTVSTDFKSSPEDRTSCTRRYRSKHPIMKAGSLATVESVVIRYRAITFACFETGGVYFSGTQPKPANSNFTLEEVPKLSSPYKRSPPALFGHIDEARDSKRARFMNANGEVPSLTISTSSPLLQPPNHAYADLHANGGVSPTVASASAILGSFSHQAHEQAPSYQPHPLQQSPIQREGKTTLELPVSRPGGAHTTSPASYALPLQQPHQGYSLPSLPVPSNSFASYPPHPLSHAATSAAQPNHPTEAPALPPSSSYVPSGPSTVTYAARSTSGPRHEESRASPNEGVHHLNGDGNASDSVRDKAEQEKAKRKARRELSKSKNGPAACQSCGIVNSPEWRKGPDGSKSLCNACGLRYARSVARQSKQGDGDQNGNVPKKRGRGKGKKTLNDETTKAAAAAAAAAASAAGGAIGDKQDNGMTSNKDGHEQSLSPVPGTSGPMAQHGYPAPYFNGVQHHPHAPPYGGSMPQSQPQYHHPHHQFAPSPSYRLPQVVPPSNQSHHERHPTSESDATFSGHAAMMDYHHPHAYMHDPSLQHQHQHQQHAHAAYHNGHNHPPPPHLWLPPPQSFSAHGGHHAPGYGAWSGVPPHPHSGAAPSPPRQA